MTLIFTHQVFKKQFNILFIHCSVFLFSACFSLGMLVLLELVVFIRSHLGKSETLYSTFQCLVFSVARTLLRKTLYSLVEESTNRVQKYEWVFENSAACFAGLYAFLLVILINLEISSEVLSSLWCLELMVCFSVLTGTEILQGRRYMKLIILNMLRDRAFCHFFWHLMVGKTVKINILFNVSHFSYADGLSFVFELL